MLVVRAYAEPAVRVYHACSGLVFASSGDADACLHAVQTATLFLQNTPTRQNTGKKDLCLGHSSFLAMRTTFAVVP